MLQIYQYCNEYFNSYISISLNLIFKLIIINHLLNDINIHVYIKFLSPYEFNH